MKTNGLVWSAAILLLCAPRATAQCCDPADCLLEQQEAQIETIPVYGFCNWCTDSCLTYVFTGAEFTFLSVDSHSGGHANLSLDDTGTAGTDLQLAGADSLSDFGFAPRVWLGCHIINDWSLVGRYWHLDDSGPDRPQAPAGAVNLANFLRLSGTSSVEADAADLEVDRGFACGPWKIDGAVGVRHATIDLASHLATSGTFTAGNTAALNLSDSSDFEGTGVTYAIVVRRQIGESHWQLFASARGSNLAGESNSSGRAVVAINTGGGNFSNSVHSSNDDDSASMTIGELQAGLEYDVPLECVPANVFFRAAYEFQNWNFDGRSAAGPSSSGSAGPINVNATISPGIGDLQLNGLTLATGLTW
jgi:hypothetical protein